MKIEERLRDAVVSAVNDDLPASRTALRQVVGESSRLRAERSRLIEIVWGRESSIRKPPRGQVRSERENVTASAIRATFQRDRFTCRYTHCQRRTIYIPVMKELSRLYPELMPYHKNWKPLDSHILYWVWGTSLEHILSFPLGGTSRPDNLITACYQCNDLKNYLPHEVLGWTIAEVSQSDWDGLSSYLPALKRIGHSVGDRSSRTYDRLDIDYQPSISLHDSTNETASESDELLLTGGCFVRLRLPGKNSARSYRIDLLTEDHLTLTEMWRRDVDHSWVASKKSQSFSRSEVRILAVLRSMAPIEGSVDLV